MFGFGLMISSFIVGCCIWFFGIKSYLFRKQERSATGANLLFAAWIDCQKGLELSRSDRDKGARLLCVAFVFSNLTFLLGILIMVLL
jgi:hypothetical protein